MNFISKYISNPFYLKKDKRIELREVLFREIVVNMLIHREYSNPFVSRVTITTNAVIFENANKPVHPGKLHRGEIRPYPKNPNIVRIFHIIGLVEELGSGVGKIFEFAPILLGGEPIIDNEDQFIVKLPVNSEGLSNLANSSDPDQTIAGIKELNEDQKTILKLLSSPLSTRELYEAKVDWENKNINSFRTQMITPLLEAGWIKQTIPDKPKSPKQKYIRQ